MANCYIAYPNRVDTSTTFSGGGWVSTLPASNMGTRPLKQVARTLDLSDTNTQFKATLPLLRPVRTLAIVSMNLSAAAKVRFKVYGQAGAADPIYDSGQVDAYPGGTAAYGTIPWGSDRWWGGFPSAEDFKLYSNNVIHVLPSVVQASEVQVLISDPTNVDGYVQVGRLFVGDGWEPTYNMTYGASLGYESRTGVEEARSGAEYFDVQKGFRVARFKFDHLDKQEAFGRLMDIQKLVDIHGEVLYLWDPEDGEYLSRTSFLGRLRQLDAIEQPYYDKYSSTFEIKELL